MKVLAIGDIHTKLWILEAVEKLIDKYDAIVFCGDYADDWNASPAKSIETWKQLHRLAHAYPKKVFPVLGNHDYIYVNNTPTIQSGYNHVTQTLINAPENKDLRDWLARGVPIIQEIDGVTYSHAGVTSDWDGEEFWNDRSPIWVRPSPDTPYKPNQVVGHTPVDTCNNSVVENAFLRNVWFIDTFSTHPDGTPIGDHTVLEVIDGKKFNPIKLI